MIKHHKQLLNNSQNKNDGKNNGWRWKKANNEEANIIRKENEKQLLNEGEDSMYFWGYVDNRMLSKYSFSCLGYRWMRNFPKMLFSGF